MGETQLDRGKVFFQTEGRLLQELGERLVATPEVALVELVKNSYDADSSSCSVKLAENDTTLIVRDDGVGMTLDDFKQRWMRIATSRKVDDRVSKKYHRRLTGQKGIGRFAVRFLGQHLRLETVAKDKPRACKTRLIADFDWQKLDLEQDLGSVEIPYQLLQVDESENTGTSLTVRKLKIPPEFAKSPTFRTSVLRIVSPLEGLERGRFGRKHVSSDNDPGFRVTLPEDSGPSDQDLDLAQKVLSRAWASLTVDLTQDILTYSVTFHDDKRPRQLRLKDQFSIANGLFADVRFFPRRSGIFRGGEVRGQSAWTWVRENCGVAVVDHGFRMSPYGFPDDDWLHLDYDNAHSRRDWRSPISQSNFPIPDAVRAQPANNPALNLSTNFQLVGAVFVESAPPTSARTENELIPAMDRQGFLKNRAFEQLGLIIRTGIEFLAMTDKEQLQRANEVRAKKLAQQTRKDFKAAISYIEKSPTLTRGDKNRIVSEYTTLAEKIVEVEQYDREARRKLETMSALGVVAGFMTHEATRIIFLLGEVLSDLEKLAKKFPGVRKSYEKTMESYTAFKSHLEYTNTFIDATHHGKAVSFSAASQVQRIIDKFGIFARDRGISVECQIDGAIKTPPMPVTIYSGVLLNLYTNALKAILAAKSQSNPSRILFRARNDEKWHIVEVMDTGVGIPPTLRDRIWDPMFTTTSRLNNPLGSGMGLGLTLVKQLVDQVNGRIEIVDAPPGFSTCFRVSYPGAKSK